MNVFPIRNEKDLDRALEEVSALMELNPQLGSEEFDRLEVMSTLIEAYEAKHHPIDAPDPIAVLKLYMERGGLSVKDLGPIIGPPNRVYEVLNGTRPLSINMIRRLHEQLGIPAELLIRRAVA